MLTLPTYNVLVWKNESIYNSLTGFKTLRDFDPRLSERDFSVASTFDYKDVHNEEYVISAVPFFPTAQTGDASTLTNSLVILVFARKAVVESALIKLTTAINDSTADIVTHISIIMVVTVLSTIVLLGIAISYITRPLEAMRQISEEIILQSAEEDGRKEYQSILTQASRNVGRTDEIGVLAEDYYYVVCLLRNKYLSRKTGPKGRLNPFLISQQSNVLPQQITWAQYVTSFCNFHRISVSQLYDTIGKDVGGTLYMYEACTSSVQESSEDHPPVDAAVLTGGHQHHIHSVSPEVEKDDLITLPHARSNVGLFTSLKSQLRILLGVVLLGVLATMLLTILNLSSAGPTWMRKAKGDIAETQVSNLNDISFAKSIFVQVKAPMLTLTITLTLTNCSFADLLPAVDDGSFDGIVVLNAAGEW